MENQELRTYNAPELTQYGTLEAITSGMVCTGLGHKDYTGTRDDVTDYGYWGIPYCDPV
ncbi:MAG: hypothetical protein ACE5Q6_22040 [Dehalococcoidia bacterium]